MSWLFDGQGVEWSDLAQAMSLQQRQKMLQQQQEMLERLGTGAPAKKVDGPTCPHCGGALPADVMAKKYEFCMHCRNRFFWGNPQQATTLQTERVGLAKKGRIEQAKILAAQKMELTDFPKRLQKQRIQEQKAALEKEEQLERNRLKKERRKAEAEERQRQKEWRKTQAEMHELQAEEYIEEEPLPFSKEAGTPSERASYVDQKAITLACPSCMYPIPVIERQAGIRVTCAGCGDSFVLRKK